MNKNLLSLSSCALFVFCAVTSLVPNAAQAQSGPQKGYIVPLDGDTLRGTVTIGRTVRNSQQCEFKSAGATGTKQYRPAELRAYGTELISYESQRVPVSADSATTLRPVFAEVLARGPYTLYAVVDNQQQQRFFLGGYRAGKLVELTQSQATIQRSGQQYLVTQRSFQDTLARAFQACPEQAKKVKQYSLGLASMQRAVENYNRCVAPGTVIKQTAQRGHFAYGITAGYATSDKLVIGKGENTSEINSEYEGQSYFYGGVEVVLTPGFKDAPFSVHSGLLYEQGRHYSSDRNFYPSDVTAERVTMKWNYLVVPVMLRYSFGKGLVRPYAEAGGSFRFMTKVEENELRIERSRTTFLPTSQPFLNKVSGISYGIGAGVGAEISVGSQQVAVGVRAERMNGPAIELGRSYAQNVSLRVSYIFNK